MSTKFGVDSSSRFSFRAWTLSHRVIDATDHSSHVSEWVITQVCVEVLQACRMVVFVDESAASAADDGAAAAVCRYGSTAATTTTAAAAATAAATPAAAGSSANWSVLSLTVDWTERIV